MVFNWEMICILLIVFFIGIVINGEWFLVFLVCYDLCVRNGFNIFYVYKFKLWLVDFFKCLYYFLVFC